MRFYDSFLLKLSLVADDEKKLQAFLAGWVFRTLMVVSLVMSLINVITAQYALMFSTLLFGLFSALDYVISKKNMQTALTCFSGEVVLLFLFFLVSGVPEGFSAIWICLLPIAGLLLYGKKRGTVISISVFFLLILLLWTPLNHLLFFDYTASFRLRFPFLYLSFFAIGFISEEIRGITFSILTESKKKYQELSYHDSLTGAANNLGLKRAMDKAELQNISEATCLVIDVDNMKAINDTMGHAEGDICFCQVANIIMDFFEKKGTVARWNGSSFSVFLPGKQFWKEEADILRKIVEMETFKANGEDYNMTVTIGGAHGLANTTNGYQEILRDADSNMYEAKKQGKNTVHFPDEVAVYMD